MPPASQSTTTDTPQQGQPLRLIALLLAALLAAGATAQTNPSDEGQDAADAAALAAADALHAPFSRLLGRFVHDGVVDYRGLAAESEALDGYIAALGRASPGRGATAFAYWINAYNAFTLRLILDHYPDIESIKDISSGKRWKAERWVADGRRLSLDTIEHKILRPMGDPRIHFAVNCASISCPDLRSEAFLPSRLDSQLDAAALRFLSDPHKGARVATESGFFGGADHNLYVSSIFDWFEEDFERWGGGVVAFVQAHGPPETAAYITEHHDDLDLEIMDYDWSLNGR